MAELRGGAGRWGSSKVARNPFSASALARMEQSGGRASQGEVEDETDVWSNMSVAGERAKNDPDMVLLPFHLPQLS